MKRIYLPSAERDCLSIPLISTPVVSAPVSSTPSDIMTITESMIGKIVTIGPDLDFVPAEFVPQLQTLDFNLIPETQTVYDGGTVAANAPDGTAGWGGSNTYFGAGPNEGNILQVLTNDVTGKMARRSRVSDVWGAWKLVVLTDDIIPATNVTMSGGGTSQDYSGHATRAAFVTWASGKTPAVGTVISAGGYAYRYIGSGTAISDLPGWVPQGEVNLAHWGPDLTGATNEATKLSEAFTYAKGGDLYLPAGTIAFTGTLSSINTDGSNLIGAGIGKTVLVMTAASTTFVQAFSWTAGRCKWSDFTFNFPTLANCSVAFANYSGSNNRFERVRWVGGVTGGASPSHNAYVLNFSTSADVDGLTAVDCEEERTTYGILKTNANTRATKNVRIVNHSSKNCYVSPMHSINSPNGLCQDITMEGGLFQQDAGVGSFPIVGGVATGNNVSISGLKIRGKFADCLHIEEKARIVNISNCVGELSGGSFITLTSNDIGGTYERPEQVNITNVQAEQIGSQLDDGLRLSYDANTISAASNVVASNLMFKNFEYGIVVGTRGDDNVRMSDAILVNCAYGAFYTGDATLNVERFTFVGCTTAIKANRGGLADSATFHSCTNTHEVTTGVLQLRNPKFNFGTNVITGSTTKWFRLVKGVRRVQAVGTLRAYQDTVDHQTVMHTLNWDGTTETSTQLQNITSAGAISINMVFVDEASALAVTAGGTGYTVGDVLTVAGGTLESSGTRTTATVATVSAGVVTGVTLTNPGEWATAPAGAATTTGGTGSGCTLTLTTAKSIAARVFSSLTLTVTVTASIDGSVFVV